MEHNENIYPFVINSIIAIVLLAIVNQYFENLSRYGYILSGVFAVVAIVHLVKYILILAVEGFTIVRHSNSVTPASEFAKSINGLPIEALPLVRGFTIPHVRIYAGGRGQEPDYFIGNTSVTYHFAEEILNNSDGVQLHPVRSYSDGSVERRMSQEFTEYLRTLGWVTMAAGNHSAMWVNGWSPWNAKVSFGMITNELENNNGN